MPLSVPIQPLRPSTAPSATGVESLEPSVQLRWQTAPLPRSPSSVQTRKPLPTTIPDDMSFSAGTAFQPDEKFNVAWHRKSTPPSFTALQSSQRAALSNSQASYPVARSALISSAMDPTFPHSSPKTSFSPPRNSSNPSAIFYTTRSHDTPTRSVPNNPTRPSLSSPSPPTPIVPSIPLRHATQHSPAESLTVVTSLPTPHASHSIATSPLDRRFPSVKVPVDHSPTAVSFTTASDPNLSSRSCTTTPDLNQYSLPLKKLLSKPASPSTFQHGSDTEGLDSSFHHQRSTSAVESVRFSSKEFDASSIERSAIFSLQVRGSLQDRSGHAIDYNSKKQGCKHSPQASSDQRGWWSGLRQGDKESKSKVGSKDKAPHPPRNVLRRRPSNSFKSREPRSPTPSTTRSLTRSLSASSFLKLAGLSRDRSPSVLSPSSSALNSPSPKSLQSTSSDCSGAQLPTNPNHANEIDKFPAHSHVEHASAKTVHDANTNNNVVTNDDTPANSIHPSLLTPMSVSKERRQTLHSVPSTKSARPTVNTRLSTISSVSGSSAGSKRREKALSPAGSIAEAYKREQLAEKSDNSSPSPALQSSSPKLSSTAERSTEKIADNVSGSKRSSNSGLSYYTDTKPQADNVMKDRTNLDGDVKEDVEILRQISLGIGGVMVTNTVVTRSSSNSNNPHTPTLAASRSSVSSPQLSSEYRARNRLRKPRHTSAQIDAGSMPYYTVVGERSEKLFSVGGPRDSMGEDWGIRTVITAGRPSTAEETKERASISRSLSRKISGKFRRERSVGPGDEKLGARIAGEGNEEGSFGKTLTRKMSGKFKQGLAARESHEGFEEKAMIGDNETTSFGRQSSRKSSAQRKRIQFNGENDGPVRGRAMPQDGRAIPTVSPPRASEDVAHQRCSEDRCLPYFYSAKKEAQSETDLATKERSSGKLPGFWRLFGRSRSKSRESNGQGFKTSGDPPPLPALPKHYVTDHRGVHTSPPPRKSWHSSKSSPSTPSGRPSTGTSENAPRFWNRYYSAPSSTSSLEISPTSSPRINLKRHATTDDTNRMQTQKHEALNATRSSRGMHVEVEQQIYKPEIDAERSNSPPIPSFSTVDTINSFRPRPSSSDRSKNSPTSVSTPSPTSPPLRPARSSQRVREAATQPPPRRNSFGDEALYPPVMKVSTRPSPKMTYRELAPGKGDAKLSEKEKADRWVALLEKSDAAGGTLHFGGIDDKLPSDDLRFSRTLSELARDDDDD